ncbi:TRAP transporter small permease [Anaerobacillus sp. MEB173]|uniref:TRAP transporter small permease n=1 Tax=Anaerobacillus sp. MEB173 TaxID=3383345 RepID=UPI003F932471
MYGTINRGVERLSNVLNNISKALLGGIVGLMLLSILIQVVLRYVFNTGLSWPEELTKFLMAWMTFIGSAIAIKQSEHISLDILVNKLSNKPQFFLIMVSRILILSFFAFFTYVGLEMALNSQVFRADALGISLFWPRISMAIGGLLMILHTVHLIFKDIGRVMNK